MTDEQVSTPVKQEIAGRDSQGRFVPGMSGNPSGRPKGLSITQMLREVLPTTDGQTGKRWIDLIIEKIIIKAAVEGDPKMITAIWAYLDGKPKEKLQLVPPEKEMSDEELRSEITRLEKELGIT